MYGLPGDLKIPPSRFWQANNTPASGLIVRADLSPSKPQIRAETYRYRSSRISTANKEKNEPRASILFAASRRVARQPQRATNRSAVYVRLPLFSLDFTPPIYAPAVVWRKTILNLLSYSAAWASRHFRKKSEEEKDAVENNLFRSSACLST